MDYRIYSVLERIRLAYAANNKKLPGIENVTDSKVPDELSMSYEELRKKNLIKEIKKDNYTLYAVKTREKFTKYDNDFQEKADTSKCALYEKVVRDYKVYLMDRLTWDELSVCDLLSAYKELNLDGYKNKYLGKYKVAYSATYSG